MSSTTTTTTETQTNASSGVVASSGHVQTTVNYWKSELDQQPIIDKSLSFHDRKIAFYKYLKDDVDACPIVVEDIRGREEEFSLEQQGFQLIRHEVQTQDFSNDDRIKKSYYPEVEALIKEVTGAYRVHIYDHMIRNRSFEASYEAPPVEDCVDIPGPARMVHVDNTPECARRTVRETMPGEGDELVHVPFSLVNVWRPLRAVRKDPLAVGDARSLKPDERVEVFLPALEGEDYGIWQIRQSARHRWYFARNQRPDEFLFFKIYDSRAEETFMGVPHTSFVDPETEHLEEDRASIEIRCLCFFDEGKV